MAEGTGRRRIGDTAEAFNDISFLAGLSPNLVFENITLTVSCAVSQQSTSLLQPYYAAILVLPGLTAPANSNRTTEHNLSPHTEMSTDRPEITWFPQTVKHIPDVYALLHAVFNSSLPDTFEPNSIFDRLAKESMDAEQMERGILIQQAADLQKAFVTAVANSVWGLPARRLPADGANAESLPPQHPASIVPDRYYAFVISATTSQIFCIDSARGQPEEIDHVQDESGTVMTTKVLRKMQEIMAGETGDEEVAIVGLTLREA